MVNIPFRQLHLDFHTSPDITDVGVEFDAQEFVQTLKKAHINGINVFAKCHHGMSYYPTKIGREHPHNHKDLLGEMLNVLNKEAISAILYFPIGWEETSADHENWLEVSPEGVLGGKQPFDDGFYRWRKLCLNNKEYREFIKSQVTEIMTRYQFTGFWFDIIFQEECLCKTCLKEMKDMGMNPRDSMDRKKHDFIILEDFQKDLLTFVHDIDQTKTVFFNGAWTPDGGYDERFNIEKRGRYQTHIEVESLPSELWGYNLFPLYVNYHNRHNAPCIGMNGKFHNAWGDFGSLRNEEALEYECFRMIMNGSTCSIGDQLHPRGQLDKATYKRIGNIYSQILDREPWCMDDRKVSEIGVIMSHKAFEKEMLPDEGVLRMMLELKYQFDFIDWQDDFDRYKLLLLPDHVYFNDDGRKKIEGYIANGGKIIATHESGLNKETGEYLLKDANINYLGKADYTPMYLDLDEKFDKSIEPMKYSLYETGSKVIAKDEKQIRVHLYKPYFNRIYDRFCSHRQFPHDCQVEEAGIVGTESVIYISHPIFTDYIVNGVRIYRDIIQKCILTFLKKPLVVTNLPSSTEVTVRKQKNRLVVHMSHYIAEKKSKRLDLVDTKLPIHHFDMKVLCEYVPSRVYIAPMNETLNFTEEDGYMKVHINELFGHQMLVIEE